MPGVGLAQEINQFSPKYRVKEGLSLAIEAACIAAERGCYRGNLGVLAKNHVGRLWREHLLGGAVTDLEHVDFRKELLARPEKDP